MAEREGVLVFVEASGGRLSSPTLKALPAAGRLAADMGQPLGVALLGYGVTSLADELAQQGVPAVYLVDHPVLGEFLLEVYAYALRKVVERARPQVVLVPQTLPNRALAPYLALGLGAGVVTNCLRLSYDSGGVLEAHCSVMGGAATAVYRFEDEALRVVALQPDEVEAAGEGPREAGRVVPVDADLDDYHPKSKIVQRTEATGPTLEEARIIVAGGRGLGNKENFRYIEELAQAVGGLPAASRAIVDMEWATPAQQIGLTGKVVSPDLYFAVGISGASQHMAGCSAANAIVAVNNDGHSTIFRYARYGVVADCLEFLPAFIEECRKLPKV